MLEDSESENKAKLSEDQSTQHNVNLSELSQNPKWLDSKRLSKQAEERQSQESADTAVNEGQIQRKESTEENPFSIKATIQPRKYIFQLKQNSNGNILTVHHTVQQDGKFVRIRLGVCCFNERGNHFLVIDKRGNVFIFDLVGKRHWMLSSPVLKANVVKPSIYNADQYLVGTKHGHLLLIDVETSSVQQSIAVSSEPVTEITFPGQPLQPSRLVLINAGSRAVIVNLDTFTATHRLVFEEPSIVLKFASYLPQSENIFTCFANDAVHVWSGVTLNTLRVAYPIKARNRKLSLTGVESVQEFTLDTSSATEFQIGDCREQDYANGLIIAYCCMPDGSSLCLSTLDGYLLLLSPYTFQLEKMFRLRDFILKECLFLPRPKETLLLGLTNAQQVLLLDCNNTELKLMVQSRPLSRHIDISRDGKLLAVLSESGEANLWANSCLYNTLKSQMECMQMLRDAFKQKKPLAPNTDDQCFNEEIRKMLKVDRLLAILAEFGSYPAKYRSLIWCNMLRLPCNRDQFQLLLQMDVPKIVKQRAVKLQLKNENLKRALLKIWSCLAHWCKVLAYCDFLPQLIFPFVKLFPRNSLVVFEICATLIRNHFQLWFEFHPLAPANYLGFCENVLQKYDPALCKYYAAKELKSSDYAWPLLTTAFSEVLDEDQWLRLWDHIISSPPYLPVFCVVAYNMLQREVVMRLPDKEAIQHYFHEQNPVDIGKMISKSHRMMKNYPADLHPKRYMTTFQPIPKNVYPKFLNYPHEWLTQHEMNVNALQNQQREIDARIRQLEAEEMLMMERLNKGLKEDELAKRVKDMEKLYKDTLQREEERIACQRKMLLLYQKELRNRKGEVFTTLQELEGRKKALQMEKDLDVLQHGIECERLRNDTELLLAEDAICSDKLELLTQKYLKKAQAPTLSQKYHSDLKRISEERALLSNSLRQISSQAGSSYAAIERPLSNLDQIEQQVNDIQEQFMRLTN